MSRQVQAGTLRASVIRDFYTNCGRCGKGEEISGRTRGGAETSLRCLNWTKTTAHGWLCPNCAARQPQGGE